MADRAESVIPAEVATSAWMREPGPLRQALTEELARGKCLIDSTPEERLMMAATWSLQMQDSRLSAMGLC